MINIGDNVIDIGCDHGLLDIYLTKFKNCHCIASDISMSVLKNTQVNIKKHGLDNKIKVICSNGLERIDVNLDDIIVISGMGTNTIIDILNSKKTLSINNLIIQSNNEIELLRMNVIKKGFYIYDEKIITDNKKDYIIIYFKRGHKNYKNIDYLFGPIIRLDSQYKNFFNNLYIKNQTILNSIPNKYLLKKFQYHIYLKKIKKFTSMKF